MGDMGAAVGGGPGADAVGGHRDGPAGVVLEPVVRHTERLKVGLGRGSLGVTDDVVEVAAFGIGGAARKPTGPISGPHFTGQLLTGSVHVGVGRVHGTGVGVRSGKSY